MTAGEVRLSPRTAILDLEVNAGEDMTFELVVVDELDVPVPLSAAEGTIAIPRCEPLHIWTTEAGNLRLGSETGQVFLDCSSEDTTAWARWGDAEWQLDVTDIFGRDRRPVEGDFRVNPTRAAE